MDKNQTDVGLTTLEEPGRISNWDLFKTWIRWLFFCEVAHSYERFQALAFCYALIPILKKLYPKREEEFNEALARHLEFFNTQAIWGGGTILGTGGGKIQSSSEWEREGPRPCHYLFHKGRANGTICWHRRFN